MVKWFQKVFQIFKKLQNTYSCFHILASNYRWATKYSYKEFPGLRVRCGLLLECYSFNNLTGSDGGYKLVSEIKSLSGADQVMTCFVGLVQELERFYTHKFQWAGIVIWESPCASSCYWMCSITIFHPLKTYKAGNLRFFKGARAGGRTWDLFDFCLFSLQAAP